MLNLVLQRQKLYEMLSLLSYTRLFDLRSHRCVKEGKVCGKRVLAFDFCLVFILWNQIDYGKVNKSLCLSMHSKIGNLTQMQVGYGKFF